MTYTMILKVTFMHDKTKKIISFNFNKFSIKCNVLALQNLFWTTVTKWTLNHSIACSDLI